VRTNQMIVFTVLFSILIIACSPSLSYALGDYHYAYIYKEIPFNSNGQTGNLTIGCQVYQFYDRIVRVIDEPITVNIASKDSNFVEQHLSARQKDDYTVTISGVINIRNNYADKGQYFYKIISIYTDIK